MPTEVLNYIIMEPKAKMRSSRSESKHHFVEQLSSKYVLQQFQVNSSEIFLMT